MNAIISFVGKALIALLILYALLLVILWFAQRALLFPAPAGIAPLPSGYTQVEMTTSDGLRLKAAYRPAQMGQKTLIFFHGNGDNWTGAAVATQTLAAAGYGVVLPEYPGYAGNPGSPGEQELYRGGRAALAWMQQQGIGPDQTIIIGNSIGSGVATQLAVETPPAALILISPFASLPQLVGEKLPFVPVRLMLRDTFENSAKMPKLLSPVLILHGDQDTLIPLSHAQRLTRANPSAALRVIAGAGHELAYIPESQAAILVWLKTHQ